MATGLIFVVLDGPRTGVHRAKQLLAQLKMHQRGSVRMHMLKTKKWQAPFLAYRASRVGDRRGGVQEAPWRCPPFPASCPFRGSITPSPAPATSNRTGGFPASRLTAEASSIGVMGPFSWGMLSRSSTPRGSLEKRPHVPYTTALLHRFQPNPLRLHFLAIGRLTLRSTSYLICRAPMTRQKWWLWPSSSRLPGMSPCAKHGRTLKAMPEQFRQLSGQASSLQPAAADRASRRRRLRFLCWRRRRSELMALMNVPSTTLGGVRRIGQLEAQGIGQRQYVLSGRHEGEKEIYAESCRIGHATTEPARAKSTALARKGYDSTMPARFASDAQKAATCGKLAFRGGGHGRWLREGAQGPRGGRRCRRGRRRSSPIFTGCTSGVISSPPCSDSREGTLGDPKVRPPRKLRVGSLRTIDIWSNPLLLLLAVGLLAAEWTRLRCTGRA